MTDLIEQLRALSGKTTEGPWSVPHFARDDCECDCGYVLAEYGGMGSIAEVRHCHEMDGPWGDDNGPNMDQAKANATLISLAPSMAEKLLAAEETEKRLRAALDVTMAMHAPDLPGDSRAVPDWFVACAAVQCDLDDSDGQIMETLNKHRDT